MLVVEDDAAIRRGLVDALRFAGYVVYEAADGRAGLDLALGTALDLVLLDVILPKLDGFAVLERLRAARPTIPVIMVTARGAEPDRVHGLRGGADDYVVKPFSATELLARVEAVLRRSAARPLDLDHATVAGRAIDFARREIRVGNDLPRSMSERESDVLLYLARNPGRAVSREELLQNVWGLNPVGVETRTVDMHVARLREKLGDDPDTPSVIATVRGKGYMLAQR